MDSDCVRVTLSPIPGVLMKRGKYEHTSTQGKGHMETEVTVCSCKATISTRSWGEWRTPPSLRESIVLFNP
jgi:hypothetical protein